MKAKKVRVKHHYSHNKDKSVIVFKAFFEPLELRKVVTFTL